MKLHQLAPALLLIVLAGAFAVRSSVARDDSTARSPLRFFVFQRVAGQIEPLAHVTTVIVRGDVVQSVGKTDERGHVSVEKTLLERPDAAVILFCNGEKSWSCNAVRLDVDREAILAFDELNVELAGGLQIVDRRGVGPLKRGQAPD